MGIQNKGIEIVKFSTDWCGPCKNYAPIFEKAKEQFGDKWSFVSVKPLTKEQIAEQNGDRDENLPPLGEYVDFAAYAVNAVPCTIVLKDGEEVGRKQGIIMSPAALEKFVEGCL